MCDKHDFVFDEDRAYSEQLDEALMRVAPEHLIAEPGAPSKRGVYAIFEDGDLRYVGKTSAGTGSLRLRLSQHARTIARRGLADLAQVTCRYLVIPEDWRAVRAEALLIKRYDAALRREFPLAWQRSGFGSHDPGSNRPAERTRWGTLPASNPEE